MTEFTPKSGYIYIIYIGLLQIFYRTEETFPLTVHQASFGTASKSVMKQMHIDRKRNFQKIKVGQ